MQSKERIKMEPKLNVELTLKEDNWTMQKLMDAYEELQDIIQLEMERLDIEMNRYDDDMLEITSPISLEVY